MTSRLALSLIVLALAGCGTAPKAPVYVPGVVNDTAPASLQGQEVAMYALMLLQTEYKYGGKSPVQGLDCSGLVSFVYNHAVGIRLTGNAAALARQGRQINRSDLRSGDLVFFNTLGRPFSHVGIYLGSGEFIHAPNARSKVRVDKLSNPYYSTRFEIARTVFD